MLEFAFPCSVQVMLQQVQKMTLIAKVLSALVLLFYGLSFVPHVEENLAMVPA